MSEPLVDECSHKHLTRVRTESGMMGRCMTCATVVELPPSNPPDAPDTTKTLADEATTLAIAERVEEWYDDANATDADAHQFAADIGTLLSLIGRRDATIEKLAMEINELRYPAADPSIPSDSGELERALRNLESKVRTWAVIWSEAKQSADPSLDELLTARKSVLNLFERLQNRIAELEKQVETFQENEAQCCPEDWGFEEYIKHLDKQLTSLRSTALTPEEAAWLLRLKTAGHGYSIKASNPVLYAKLRSLSSLRSSSLGEQK